MLLESDAKGTRLVATDGRRLVVVELEQCESAFTGQVILPARLVALIKRLADAKQDEYLALHVEPQPEINGASQPAKLFVAGRDWLLSTVAVDGMFPKYRDVLPPTGKRFIVDREQFLALATGAALATDFECKGVIIELAAGSVHISAGSGSNGTASGSVPTTSPNASSRTIRTGFNARFLLDAVRSLTCDRLVIDVQPNQRCKTTGSIIQKPGLFYGEDGPVVRWLIMPVNVDTSA